MRPLEPLDLSLCDRTPSAPEWVIEGVLERGGVAILSGDTGTSKSLVSLSMALAVLRGEAWFGRATERGHVIVSDAEMVEREAVDRLRGFGVHGDDEDHFTYLNRQAIDLGSTDSVEALRDLCRSRRPSLLILDAVVGHAPGVDVNSNSEVVRLYTETLRPLAREGRLALLLIHHESKPGQGPRDSSLAAMGARQWVGQADVQLTLERAPKPNSDTRSLDDGGTHTTYRLRLRVPKRRHAPDSQRFEPLRVVSRHHPDGALDWLRVEADDDAGVDAERGPGADRKQERAEGMAAHVKAHGESTSAELAAAVDLKSSDGSFKRARDFALAAGMIEAASRGRYRGRATVHGP
jgi:RecA-family ATPase